ncbi:MAG: hypothetical protein AAFV43_11800 [Planctomycetota bacterium]
MRPRGSYLSTGQVCATLQTTPSRIHTAAGELKIQASLVLNGTHYYGESDIERIAKHLQAKSVRRTRRVAL